jgi:hypothetical protein
VLTALKALLGLLPFLSFVVNWLEDRRKKREAAEMAEAAVKKEEARVATTAAEVMAEHRDDNAGISRLRDGSF